MSVADVNFSLAENKETRLHPEVGVDLSQIPDGYVTGGTFMSDGNYITTKPDVEGEYNGAPSVDEDD